VVLQFVQGFSNQKKEDNMKIGLQIPSFSWPGGTPEIRHHLAEITTTADEVGFASIWVMDHFFQISYIGKPEEPMLESYSTLNYIAALTKNVRLGTLVTGVIYRNPGLLVKEVTTLDVLSGGRAYLGIGAAWNEEEAKGLGFYFPPLKERFECLEDALQIARAMWNGQESPFKSRHNNLTRLLNSPQPISKPHPPILIGGSGEKKTLRLVAKYADACNLFARTGLEEIGHKLDILKQHCDQVGRNYADIEKTALDQVRLGSDGLTAKDFVNRCKDLSQAGIQHLIISLPDVSTIKPLEIIGKEVIPAVADY
jgi:F420-dependent oxidoreductase-like protein